MSTRRDQILQELNRRRDTFTPRQQDVFMELQRRGIFEADTPEVQKQITKQEPVETVLPSGVSDDDFARIQRTGLTPGTATSFAGVNIATENERRRKAGIESLSSKQQEARLRLFQQGAGIPDADVKNTFEEAQALQRAKSSSLTPETDH